MEWTKNCLAPRWGRRSGYQVACGSVAWTPHRGVTKSAAARRLQPAARHRLDSHRAAATVELARLTRAGLPPNRTRSPQTRPLHDHRPAIASCPCGRHQLAAATGVRRGPYLDAAGRKSLRAGRCPGGDAGRAAIARRHRARRGCLAHHYVLSPPRARPAPPRAALEDRTSVRAVGLDSDM